MSKIVVLVEDVTDQAAAIRALRQATGRSIGEIRQRLAAREPVAEYVLFENDHDSVAKVLRELMDRVPASGARLRLFELSPTTTFSAIEVHARQEIDSNVLHNILKAHEEEVERQQDLGER